MPDFPRKSLTQAAADRLRELSKDLIKVAGEMEETVSSKDAHKLRTTIRRIEVAMETSDEPSGGKKLQKQMDTLRKAAGHVRDIDVQTDLLLGMDAGEYSKDCSALKNALLRRREKQEARTAAKIEKELGRGLEKRLEKAAAAIESATPLPHKSVKERVDAIRAQYVEFTTEVPLDGVPLHDLRKATKRLRYRLEAIPGRTSRALEQDLKNVQDLIGEWHDWATLTAEAEEILEPRSIAFVAFLRSRSLAKRHEARRAIQTLRQKLVQVQTGKKPPARVADDGTLQLTANTQGAR